MGQPASRCGGCGTTVHSGYLVLSAEQVEAIEHNNKLFPDHLVPMGPEYWPTMAGSQVQTGSEVVAAFRSREFVVIVWRELSGFLRLSVNRTEWDEKEGRFRGDIGWDDLQRLKSEAGYGDVPAVELYPPDEHVLNTVNLRHLFLLPADPPFMWQRPSGDFA